MFLDLEKNGLSKLNDNRRVCIMNYAMSYPQPRRSMGYQIGHFHSEETW